MLLIWHGRPSDAVTDDDGARLAGADDQMGMAAMPSPSSRRPACWSAEVAKPALRDCEQPSGLKPVDVLTPPQLNRDESGLLKHAQML